MIIGGEKMRFTCEKRPFLHKYTVENADFWKNWWGSVFCWRGFARGLGGFFGDVNVAGWTDIFGWGFACGCGAGRTGGVYLDIFGLVWLALKNGLKAQIINSPTQSERSERHVGGCVNNKP